jgi:glycosyltransferase involved in cell wall biosynthesis
MISSPNSLSGTLGFSSSAGNSPGGSLRVAALIPALNASKSIVKVVEGVGRFLPRQSIIVVDDGSSDNTGQLVQTTGAVLLRHKRNRGKGAALQTGFKYVIDRCYDGVVVLDADGQHDEKFIPEFISRATREDVGILIGSRMDQVGEMPIIRVMTNRITSALVSALARQKIPDSQSGYRYIRVDILKDLSLRTSRYDTESEMLIQVGRKGYRIGSLPITSIYREEESAISPGRDTLRFLFLVLKTFFKL